MLVFYSQPPLRIGVHQEFGLSVALVDRFGNVEDINWGDVSLVLASGPGKSILSGDLTAPVQNGVAVFSGLKLNRVGQGYSIKVVSPGAFASPRTTRFGVVADLHAARG